MNRQKSFEQEHGILYLVATPIGNLEEMTPRAIRVLQEVDVIAAEDTRNTLKLLNHFNIKNKLVSHHDHNTENSVKGLIALLTEGKNIALVSDAGYPAISDPGYELCQAAIAEGFAVVPVSGANAALDALIVSGLPVQPFLFYGFISKPKDLEKLKDREETMIFYEAPHRVKKTLKNMYECFGDREAAICRELTKLHEEIIRGRLEELTELEDDFRGEIVLVVGGAKAPKNDVDDETIIRMIEELSDDLSLKEASQKVAADLGLKKNEVYQRYINAKRTAK